MTVTPIVTSDRKIYRAAAATCYTAVALREADFTPVPYLRCDQLRITCGPEIDQAQLTYVYGDILREDGTAVVHFPPLTLAGKFLKIHIPDTVYEDAFAADPATSEVNEPITWYGRIEHDEKVTAGTVPDSDPAQPEHPRGIQSLTAFGLLRLLEQEVVDTSFVDVDGTSGHIYKVQAGLNFNSDPGGQIVRRGNRSTDKIDGSYIYSWEARGFNTWSAHNAVEYLLRRQVPLDNTGVRANIWRLDADVDYLDWYDIDLPTNGRTVKQLIDALIPRQRAIGYYVDYDASRVDPANPAAGFVDEIVLHVFTFLSANLTLPDGEILKANPNQRSLDFEHALDIVESTVCDTVMTKYHRVIARGEKRTTTLTEYVFEFPDREALLVKGWSAADQAEYKAGASGAADYSALTDDQKKARNAIARSSDRLNEVFRRYVFNPALNADRWRGYVRDMFYTTNPGSFGKFYWLRGDQSVEPYSSQVQSDYPAGHDGRDYLASLRITRALPFYEQHDYSGTKLADFNYGTAFTANKHPSFIPPFVFVSTVLGDNEADWRFEMLDRLNRAWAAAGDRTWSARVAVLDTEPGLEITAHPPHFLSGNSDVGWGIMADHENPAINKGISYQFLQATICIELNEHVQWEEVLSEPPDNAPEQVLIIPVPDARFDYVLPWTVVEIKDGKAIQTTSGGFAKNDMPRLKKVAKTAAQWYSKERQTLNLAFRQVRKLFQLGWLITDIGADYTIGVNTPVTAITYSLGDGGQAGTTRIETSYTNLDFSGEGASKYSGLGSATGSYM